MTAAASQIVADYPQVKPPGRGRAIKDLTGHKFGRLLVLQLIPRPRGAAFRCQCDCGHQCEVRGTHLRTGHTKSCGCYETEHKARRETTHGESKKRSQHCPASPEYRCWCGMRTRCNNANHDDYRLYGARGIRVCERWDKFENFLKDMGRKPRGGRYSIERIKNELGYEPGNCKWATAQEQARNRRPVSKSH